LRVYGVGFNEMIREWLMFNRNVLIVACGLMMAGSVSAESASTQEKISRRPNIVFLFADDWGWGDLSCHGQEQYKTPHLDKLATQGTEFLQFNVGNPVCSASRTAVMTGQFPARHSVHQHFSDPQGNKARGMPDWLDPTAVMLPRLFKNAGYITGHFGKWHLTNTGCDDAPWPAEYGVDESGVFNGFGPQINAADASTYDKTIAFIKENKDNPFFVNVWMHEAHTPHWPKEQFLKEFENLDEQHQVYAAILAEGDCGVGRILKTLDDLGLADDTLVVFSSDNGPESTGGLNRKKWGDSALGTYYSVGTTGGLKGNKRSLFEGGVRVPFIVRWPGKTPAGKKNNTTVIAAVDLLPTFCKAADIKLPQAYKPDGENMLAAFLGEKVQRTQPIFWEWKGTASGQNWPRLGIRVGDWKLLMTDDGKRIELYNIPRDRAEQNNLANEYPEIVARLSKQVLGWKETLPEHPSAQCISKFRK